MYIKKDIFEKVVKIRKKDARMGDSGKILVIAGSKDYVGAAELVGSAALVVLRTGADLVTVAAPEKVAWAVNSLNSDLITKKIKGDYFSSEHVKEIMELSKDFDVVVVGPGLGREKETFSFVKSVVEKIKKPKVIDADAIKAIDLNKVVNAIITPHRTEFSRLLKNSKIRIERDEEMTNYVKNNVLLIKGRMDVVISKKDIAYNKLGNPGMTVGGTGDVLAGLCAGFLAQDNSLFDSACAAAYLNGAVGEKLLKKLGYGFVASDFIVEISSVLKKLKKV